MDDKHKNKFIRLSEHQDRPIKDTYENVKVLEEDLSIPDFVLNCLSMGPKHPVLEKFKSKDILTEVDSLLEYIEPKMIIDEKGQNIEDTTKNLIEVEAYKYNKLMSQRKLDTNYIKTLKYLKENKLRAVPCDKTNAFMIMKDESYQVRMKNILNGNEFVKYSKPRINAVDPILKSENEINDQLLTLMKSGKISENLYKELHHTGSTVPRLYGLAKNHKESVPLRPVLSTVNSIYHKLAKKLAFWLSHVPETQINVQSRHVVNEIKNITLEPGEKLVSFDVSSLYTKVPALEALKMAADKLYNNDDCINVRPPISKTVFIQIGKMALNNIVMLTHDGYYIQKHGLAMGSPLSSLLANIWLTKFDVRFHAMNTKWFFRYVDDIFMTLQEDVIEHTLDVINSWNKNLSFTHEIEDQTGCISFLDITIRHKEDNTIETSWYTKPTNNGVTLNFNAIAPMKFKRSVVSSFVHRIYNACSNWKNFHESIEKARHILLDNSYPNEFMTSVIHDTLERIITKSCENKSQNFMDKAEGKMLFSIQFRGPETLNFMKKLVNNYVPIIPVYTTKKLRYVMPSLKPRIEKSMRSQVVYMIKCPKCMDYYVGMTF